jgi:predicted nucleotidyltransferase
MAAVTPLPISSSKPHDFPDEQVRLFREVLQLMNSRGVPYVVSGAFALQKHTGIHRDTKDLDLFLAPEHVGKALEYLIEDGFETQIADPVWLAKAHRNGFFVDLITGMSNAVVTVDHSWIERGIPWEIMGIPTRVLAAEELIASKLFVTRRERFDGADVCHVIYATKGKLDWKRILELVKQDWEIVLWALMLYEYVYPGHSHYIPRGLWNDLLDRMRQRIANPDPGARFRGSLIDPMMFAIDVDEWGLPNVLEEWRQRRQKLSLSGEAAEPAA